MALLGSVAAVGVHEYVNSFGGSFLVAMSLSSSLSSSGAPQSQQQARPHPPHTQCFLGIAAAPAVPVVVLKKKFLQLRSLFLRFLVLVVTAAG
mmetsp:Transcript_26442/g.44203  ORF Transcript_26442/g.44203 Transcript_26442/m.44203 type:complete len:93 (-) Transcript_26442:326-604(-)